LQRLSSIDASTHTPEICRSSTIHLQVPAPKKERPKVILTNHLANLTQYKNGTSATEDPWERYQDESMMYASWWGDKLWTMVPGVTIVGQFFQTFKEYPPSQMGGTLSIERALALVQQGASGGH
jgi:hypothetical protein